MPIVDLAKELGLYVVETSELDDNYAGSLSKEGDNFVIYINTSHPLTRKRFTIAHEIAHFIQHKHLFDTNNEHIDNIKQPVKALNSEEGRELTDAEKKIEIEANNMAADLLMPKDLFLRVWKNAISLPEVAEQFKVSESAATLRARFLLGQTIV